MTNEAIEARKAYRREYYARTKEKQKQYTERYWEKRAAIAAEERLKIEKNNIEGE